MSAFVRGACEELAECAAVAARLASTGPEPLLCARFLELVRAVAYGSAEGLADEAREVEVQAARHRLASIVVETACIRALIELERCDQAGATTIARRAARMARVERLPQSEYLAGLVLARVRRHGGRPHLATRILTALAGYVSPEWRTQVEWESLLAGGAAPLAGSSRSPLAEFLAEVRSNAPIAIAFERADARLRMAPQRVELHALARTLDPDDADYPLAPRDVHEWRRGAGSLAPRGIFGVCASDALELPAVLGWVVCDARGARRVLRTTLSRLAGEYAIVGPRERKHSKVDAAVAALALAGEAGAAPDDLFEAVYGFGYRAELHRSAFDVLLHRLRQHIDGFATTERSGERIVLRIERACVLPDPRCNRPIDDRLLQLLAAMGTASARDAAAALDAPLRTVQRALAELVADGACVKARDGREVAYAIEDTTFSEPTRH